MMDYLFFDLILKNKIIKNKYKKEKLNPIMQVQLLLRSKKRMLQILEILQILVKTVLMFFRMQKIIKTE